MAAWTADERHRKVFGRLSMVPERRGDETAHLVDLGGREIRVLPDGLTSGQRRSRVISEALGTIQALDPSVDLAETILVGVLARAGLSWEKLSEKPHEHRFEVAGIRASRERQGALVATLICPDCGDGWTGYVEPAGVLASGGG